MPSSRSDRGGGPPTWRSILPEQPEKGEPLALGVELRRRDAAGERHWSVRPMRAALPRDLARGSDEVFLGVRPLRRSGSSGSWIQGDTTWDGVRRPGPRYAAAHSRWFADLLSIARDSLLSGTAGDWLLLDPVESPLLWPHLRRARELGIALVATQGHTELRWAEEARVGVVAASDGPGEGILLSAEVVCDGVAMTAGPAPDGEPATVVQTIGSTGVYAYRVVGVRVELIVGEASIGTSMRALLEGGGRVRVDEQERESFFREALPLLARQGTVRADGVVLPESAPPRPALTVTHRPGDVVDFRFEWEYSGSGRHPFISADDPRRDAAAEEDLRAGLIAAWGRATEEEFAASGTFAEAATAEFMTRTVPALEAEGVLVVVLGTPRRYHELAGTPEILVRTVETTDADWFDLGVIVRIDGRDIPFAPLFRALSLRRTKALLADGGWLDLRHPGLDRLRELIDEAMGLNEWEAGPRIHRTHVALWAEFEDLADIAEPAVSWRGRVEDLRGAGDPVAAVLPEGMTAVLRPYQREGADWLARLWRHRLGGILADDMGLGKTLQMLALLSHIRTTDDAGPSLVVAPTSVLASWAQEATRFAPDLRVRVVSRTRSASGVPLTEETGDVDLVITSYTILRIDAETFAEERWAAVILDEAQNVKNPATGQYRAVSGLTAQAVYAVSGTPVENGLSELWALLSLVAPGLFPSARTFREEYIQPIEAGKVPENAEGAPYRQARIERLRRRIQPFLLRRSKERVAPELPERQEQVLRIEPSPAHRARYEAVLQRERQKILGLLPDLDRNSFVVFRSLTLLRMLSLAPVLVDPTDAHIGVRKLDVLVQHVRELATEGHRALVFSQFTSFLRLAENRLRSAGVRTAYLDGTTRDRAAVVESFRAGEQDAFLLSLKAGGVGLTLTEADYVFLLDPWWNPSAEAQAADRAHRIGQSRPVLVYRMIAAGTIEEKVLDLQRRKARLTAAVMDDGDLFARSLDAGEIRDLFGR